MVLAVQQEVYGDEVVVVGGRFQVEDEAVDAVLDEGPQEPAGHEQHWETVRRDLLRVVWEEHRHAHRA